jgi:hypothetical protein
MGWQRQFSDFVEKQRAAVGSLEPAVPRVPGTRETPLFMAKEVRVDQLGRNRAAVDAHERSRRTSRAGVNGAGHDLLAGPCFAQDQHGDIGLGHKLGALHHMPQPRFSTDDRVANLLPPQPRKQRALVRLGRLAEGRQLVQPTVVFQCGRKRVEQRLDHLRVLSPIRLASDTSQDDHAAAICRTQRSDHYLAFDLLGHDHGRNAGAGAAAHLQHGPGLGPGSEPAELSGRKARPRRRVQLRSPRQTNRHGIKPGLFGIEASHQQAR